MMSEVGATRVAVPDGWPRIACVVKTGDQLVINFLYVQWLLRCDVEIAIKHAI